MNEREIVQEGSGLQQLPAKCSHLASTRQDVMSGIDKQTRLSLNSQGVPASSYRT